MDRDIIVPRLQDLLNRKKEQEAAMSPAQPASSEAIANVADLIDTTPPAPEQMMSIGTPSSFGATEEQAPQMGMEGANLISQEQIQQPMAPVQPATPRLSSEAFLNRFREDPSQLEALRQQIKEAEEKRDAEVMEARKADRFNRGLSNLANIASLAAQASIQRDVMAPIRIQATPLEFESEEKFAKEQGDRKLNLLLNEYREMASRRMTPQQEANLALQMEKINREAALQGARVYQTQSGLVQIGPDGKPIEIYKDPAVIDKIRQGDERQELSRERFGFQRENQKYKQEEKFQDDVTKKYNEMRKNESFKGAEEVLDSIAKLEPLIQTATQKGGIALAMLGPVVAKGLAGEKGVLTDADVSRYTNNPKITAAINDKYLKAVDGKLSKLTANQLIDLAMTMKEAAKENYNRTMNEYSESFAKAQKIPTEEARYYFDRAIKPIENKPLNSEIQNYMKSVSPEQKNRQTQPSFKIEGFVTIQAPDGSIATVRSSQVDKYLKQGAKIVE